MEKELIHMLLIKQPTIREVLAQFHDLYHTPEEELKKLEITHYDIMQGKFRVVGHLIEDQIAKNHKFVVDAPFENTCGKCKGTGERFRFSRREIVIPCPKCDGNKKLQVPCRCTKTSHPGKFIRYYEKDCRVKSQCKYCGGELKVWVTCDHCLEKDADTGKSFPTGEKHLWVIDRIEHRSICDVCNGRGFFTPRKKKAAEYPAIPQTIGEEIKKRMGQLGEENINRVAVMMIPATKSEYCNPKIPLRTYSGNSECPRPEDAI
jgi:hypothetical protein